MKRIYKITEGFILNHARLQIVISIVMIVITGIMMASIYFPIPAGISFGGFLVGTVRLFTYKNGNVPIFMRDKSWESIKREETDEKVADERFRSMSAKFATVSYIVAWSAFIIALIVEILLSILNS